MGRQTNIFKHEVVESSRQGNSIKHKLPTTSDPSDIHSEKRAKRARIDSSYTSLDNSDTASSSSTSSSCTASASSTESYSANINECYQRYSANENEHYPSASFPHPVVAPHSNNMPNYAPLFSNTHLNQMYYFGSHYHNHNNSNNASYPGSNACPNMSPFALDSNRFNFKSQPVNPYPSMFQPREMATTPVMAYNSYYFSAHDNPTQNVYAQRVNGPLRPNNIFN